MGPLPSVLWAVEAITPLRGVTAKYALIVVTANALSVTGNALLAVTLLPLLQQLVSGKGEWSVVTQAPSIWLAAQYLGSGFGGLVGGGMTASVGFTQACGIATATLVCYAGRFLLKGCGARVGAVHLGRM